MSKLADCIERFRSAPPLPREQRQAHAAMNAVQRRASLTPCLCRESLAQDEFWWLQASQAPLKVKHKLSV